MNCKSTCDSHCWHIQKQKDEGPFVERVWVCCWCDKKHIQTIDKFGTTLPYELEHGPYEPSTHYNTENGDIE